MKFAILISALLLCGSTAAVRAQPIEIKMSTLAPKESQWCDVLVKMGEIKNSHPQKLLVYLT
jgi:hypothetical protein